MTKEYVDIIVVDDDPDVGEMFEEIFKNSSYSLEFYARPEDGLKAISEKRPKIAILDFNMPGLTGQEMIVKLSEKLIFKTTSLILISGENFDEMEKIRLMTLGFEKIFQKPFVLSDLIDYVASCIPPEVEDKKTA